MSRKSYRSFSTQSTHPSQRTPGRTDEVRNSEGAFVFQVDKWELLDRFLILGSDTGTYYIQPEKLTRQHGENVITCLKDDPVRTIDRIVEVSTRGLAPSNEPALFALAVCVGVGDISTKKYALSQLQAVARIGTHLFHFADYVRQFRGWGRALRGAIADWYNAKDPEKLAYQVVKYRQRDGWSHRDLLRLSHPKPKTKDHDSIFSFVTSGKVKKKAPALIQQYVHINEKPTVEKTLSALSEINLPWEALPTEQHNSVQIRRKMLEGMPMTAMVRNLNRLTGIGLLKPMSKETADVVYKLTTPELLIKARIHPIQLLIARLTYSQGHGVRGKMQWDPVAEITSALDTAFYMAFDNVEPTNKRICLAVDVSGSMNHAVLGVPGLDCSTGAGAMALITAAVEPYKLILSFSSGGDVEPVQMTGGETLRQVYNTFHPRGGTDCSLPFQYCLNNRIDVDAFVVYTDNESWAGNEKPYQVLNEYRRKINPKAKMVQVAMAGNRYQIGDPNDALAIGVSGFNASVPSIISNFIKGAEDGIQ